MDTIKLTHKNWFALRVLKANGTGMKPSLLLMCKILTLLLFVHGYFIDIKDPYIPFFSWLDLFNNMPFVFEYTLKAVFLVCSGLLFFNVKVRKATITMGFIVILSILASRSLFRNHLFIVACMLILAGLSKKDSAPSLIYYQLSLIYFGALLNKVLQLDWWTGQFMHNWLNNALENSFYSEVSTWFGELVIAKVITYAALLTELVIFLCLLIPRYRFWGISIIMIFHTLLFTLTGATFGFFMEDILIVLIGFTIWPSEQATLGIKYTKHLKRFKIFKVLDWDNRITIKNDVSLKDETELYMDAKTYTGKSAYAMTLLCFNGFFWLLVFAQLGILFLFDGIMRYLFLLLLFWSLLLLLSPIFFQKIKSTRFKIFSYVK